MLIELKKLNAKFKVDTSSGVLATLKVKPILLEKIIATQCVDEETRKLCEDAKSGKVKELNCSEEGVLKFENWLYVLNIEELRQEIIEKAHYLTYAMYLGSTKIYRALKENYWYKGMKGDITEFISNYLTCQ